MQDPDRRQLENMLQQLDAYTTNRIDLSTFISNSEALLDLLESAPESWRLRFRELWGTLEQVYSVAIDREQPVESPANRALIAPALSGMRKMLKEVLEA